MKTILQPDSRSIDRVSQFRRVRTIHARLANGERVNARSLAAELEVSERTCKRDIEIMRDSFNAPIEWDASERSYVYTRTYDLMEHAHLTAEEALSLVLASKTFAAWGDTQLARALEAAMGKVTDYLSDHATLPVSDIAALISEPPGCQTDGAGLEHFQMLLNAIRAQRAIALTYRKPSKARPEIRRVLPLHLALLERRWILIAYDPARDGIRKFVLYRIQRVNTIADQIDPLKNFDAKSYLRGSFGHFAGEEEQEVSIRILPELAPYIAEREWHPSQRTEQQIDGSLVVRLTLTSLEDIRRWVLGWGGQAEALEPAELRETVKQEIERAKGLYDV